MGPGRGRAAAGLEASSGAGLLWEPNPAVSGAAGELQQGISDFPSSCLPPPPFVSSARIHSPDTV